MSISIESINNFLAGLKRNENSYYRITRCCGKVNMKTVMVGHEYRIILEFSTQWDHNVVVVGAIMQTCADAEASLIDGFNSICSADDPLAMQELYSMYDDECLDRYRQFCVADGYYCSDGDAEIRRETLCTVFNHMIFLHELDAMDHVPQYLQYSAHPLDEIDHLVDEATTFAIENGIGDLATNFSNEVFEMLNCEL